MQTASRDVGQLLAIMEALRQPEGGCPWDVTQTFATIAPFTIEEAFEVADAIARGDLEDLRDELGDLLLQVVFQAQIASERGAFDFGDVVESITAKLIRRHPHVFGNVRRLSPDGVKALWDEIKQREKAERASGRAEAKMSVEGALSDVPAGLPALIRAGKLSRKAAAVGFDWTTAEQVLAKVDEELREVREAVDDGSTADVEGEIGDLLFSVVNLARHLHIDPEAALRRTNVKFERRFRSMEEGLAKTGHSPQSVDLTRLEELWSRAKEEERRGAVDVNVTPTVAREGNA